MLGSPVRGRASRLWLSCAVLVILCGSAAAQFKDFRQKWNLTRQDVVVAMPVDKNHLTLAKGSRIWRRVCTLSADSTLVLPRHCSSAVRKTRDQCSAKLIGLNSMASITACFMTVNPPVRVPVHSISSARQRQRVSQYRKPFSAAKLLATVLCWGQAASWR